MIPPDDRAEIMRRLERAETEHGARILLAIESGSRAWGFPSPDSDYDVRFIYTLPLKRYVSLSPVRDVIEQPIEGLFDINGWDLRKALGLMLKANPVLSEWTRSPIIYKEADGFRTRFEALMAGIDERPAAQHHHASILTSNYKRHIAASPEVKLKKYFYCLRPAYALHWMWKNPQGPLPMEFSALRSGVNEPADRAAALEELLALKTSTREIGLSPRMPAFDAFIEDTIARADASDFGRRPPPSAETIAACERFFHEMIGLEAS